MELLKNCGVPVHCDCMLTFCRLVLLLALSSIARFPHDRKPSLELRAAVVEQDKCHLFRFLIFCQRILTQVRQPVRGIARRSLS